MKTFVSGAEKEFDEFCDSYFTNDADAENYREKNICRQRYND